MYKIIELKGQKSRQLIQSISSTDLSSCTEGTGKWAAFLDRFARVQAIAAVWFTSESIYIQCFASFADNFKKFLQPYCITTQTSMTELTYYQSTVHGSDAKPITGKHEEMKPETMKLIDSGFIVSHSFWGVQCIDSFSSEQIKTKKIEESEFHNLAWNHSRPFPGIDFDSAFMLLETGYGYLADRKDCYVGQEIIARMRSRKADCAKEVVKFTIEKESKKSPVEFTHQGEIIGKITTQIKDKNEIRCFGFLKKPWYSHTAIDLDSGISLKQISRVTQQHRI